MSPSSRDTTWIGHEFDRRAATYDHHEMHRWQADQAVQLLQPQPPQRILDIATGTGLAARACARITHAPQQIVGIDVSLGMLQAAAAVSTSSYLQADAAQLPLRPATFDALLCVAAIPYLPDLAKAVTEWRRVAQPGADLVFTTPAADGIETLRLIRQAGAYDHWLEYGFVDQLRNALPAAVDAVYDSFQSAYRAQQAAGTSQHVTMFTRCSFSLTGDTRTWSPIPRSTRYHLGEQRRFSTHGYECSSYGRFALHIRPCAENRSLVAWGAGYCPLLAASSAA